MTEPLWKPSKGIDHEDVVIEGAPQTITALLDAAPYRVDFAEKPYRTYKIDGLKVPSVTQVLGILDKPALVYWSQKEAVKGVCELAMQYGGDDAVFRDADALGTALIGAGGTLDAGEWWKVATAEEAIRQAAALFVRVYEQQNCTLPFERPDDVLRLIKAGKVDSRARANQAADRGTAIHKVFEDYAASGKVPDPSEHPPEYSGYLRALAAAIVELAPRFHGSEIVVGSKRHRYGGRLDHLLTMRDESRRGLLDLKTNRKAAVYAATHGLQLAAYQGAACEMGMPEPDFRAVLAVGENGEWDLVETQATPEQFYALVPVYESVQQIEKDAKAAAKAKAKEEGK